MTSAIYSLIYVGPVVLLVSIFALPVYYVFYDRAPQPKAHLSLARFFLSAFVLAVTGFVAGSMLGVAAACLPADAGNLCGLVGIFGAGPLMAGLVLLAFGYLRTSAARRRGSRSTSAHMDLADPP